MMLTLANAESAYPILVKEFYNPLVDARSGLRVLHANILPNFS